MITPTQGYLGTQVALAVLLLSNASVWAQTAAPAAGEWASFRGPTHNGISTEKGLNTQWPKEGPKPLWKINVGAGYASVTVSGGKIFTMGNGGGQDTIYCLDATTGNEVWKHTYACASDEHYPGPRSAPVVDGGKVYSLSRKGDIYCLDAAKGGELWSKKAKDFGAKNPQWDISGSPLVYGQLVIFNLNAHGVALDKNTGAEAWKSAAGRSGYATPVPFEMGGVKGVAIFGAKNLVGVNPVDGKALWSQEWVTSYDVNAADPVFEGDKAFVTSGYNRGGAALQIKDGKAAVLWENKEIASHGASPVVLDGHIYGTTGQYGSPGALKCMELNTAAVKWTRPGLGGSLVMVDGKLIVLTYRGKVVVVEASPTGYKELANAQVLGGTCWTVPTYASGKLYCRNKEGTLICLDLNSK